MSTSGARRMAAVWCPDWPVTTARIVADEDPSADLPLAVMSGGRIVACSHRARTNGVKRGMRRREAQARCPQLELRDRDEDAEARIFEPVVAALETIAPGVEITRPGLAAISVRGPLRYFGSELAVLAELAGSVGALPGTLAAIDMLIGIADGPFAAEQAARRGLVVEPGRSASFLASLPIGVLDDDELVSLLVRLGVRTLGDFAALTPSDVLARFGTAGHWLHRQAGARDDRPLAARQPPHELTVTVDFDPPLERVDQVAFSARASVGQFVDRLAAHGLACVCLELQATAESGNESVRSWRHAGALGVHDITDRIRWHLEGWMASSGAGGGGAGGGGAGGRIARLRLVPTETAPLGAQQPLWGRSSSDGSPDADVARAYARVQSLLGHEAVRTPVRQGGRAPAQRTGSVPWGDRVEPLRAFDEPWPGRLPAPSPTVVIDPPRAIDVLDEHGHTVTVTERGAVPRPPARLRIAADGATAQPPSAQASSVQAWAGPWPVDERWWDPASAVRRARFQLVDTHGRAYLVSCELVSGGSEPARPRWLLEAVYD